MDFEREWTLKVYHFFNSFVFYRKTMKARHALNARRAYSSITWKKKMAQGAPLVSVWELHNNATPTLNLREFK